MKKLLSLLLVGTLAAAAQAVTLDWSKVDGAQSITTSANNSGSAQMTVAANTAWTASCLLTINSITNFNATGKKFPALFGVATSGTATESWRFCANFSGTNSTGLGTIGTVYNGTNGTISGTTQTLTAGTTYELVLSYDSATTTLSFYLDGELYATTSTWSNIENPYLVWGKQSTGSENQSLNYGATYTTEVNYVAGKTYTELTVPEPTVLALLAVGVAGLALRRKA